MFRNLLPAGSSFIGSAGCDNDVANSIKNGDPKEQLLIKIAKSRERIRTLANDAEAKYSSRIKELSPELDELTAAQKELTDLLIETELGADEDVRDSLRKWLEEIQALAYAKKAERLGLVDALDGLYPKQQTGS